MMNRYFPFLLGIMMLSLWGGCVDDIPLEVPEGNTQKLVIQASIMKGNPSVIEVLLSHSADFVQYFNARQISGASVKILDETQRSLLIPEARPGLYRLAWVNDGDFEIARGQTYQLEVQLPTGASYLSSLERIYAVPAATDIHIGLQTRSVLNEAENIVETPFIQFLIETPLKHPDETEKAYLKWDMEGVFRLIELEAPIPIPGPQTCYISESIGLGQVHVFNGFETSDDRLTNHLIYEEAINWNYSAGYYLTVYQQSLSKGAYEYWNKVSEVSAREGSLFEPPPGKIKSNIYNVDDEQEQVLGYFYATEVDSIRRFIQPQEANSPSAPCFAYTYETADDYCRNCLLWPNSTLRKPDYWVE